ncbi:MAG: helical backbone metal receptor [Gammaproteobacteria bacterium]|nr:helical backbone metal receptor [Gammaproteobacteria bacterium]
MALMDDVGVAHRPADGNVRIISLVPSITELVFTLGLADQLVGRTTFCVHPHPEVDSVASVGGTKTVKLDKIKALSPTHVIVNVDENRKEDVNAVAQLGCDIVVTHPIDPTDNLRLYRLLGGIFRRTEAAKALCRDFQRAHSSLLDRARSLRERNVLYLIWRDPWMTISEDTYISRTLALAGLKSKGGRKDVRYPEISFEARLMKDVDAVLLSSEPFPFKQKHVEEVRGLTEQWSLPVSIINAEMVSWYGPRAIPGLRYLENFASELVTR